ncbi:hypothetical protein ACIBCM_33790 [Streptomyces sp. NPDC051018]|uniref:hypothetical protein n=1 Tax=Streptomyces sp. NPDC051018 TaxID=3365639 RepID=UPI00379FC146
MVSPVLRPAAEHTPNRPGATLAELRTAMERAVRATMADDRWLALLPGLGIVGPGQLADGPHPDNAGHAAPATGVPSAMAPWVPGLLPPPPHGTRGPPWAPRRASGPTPPGVPRERPGAPAAPHAPIARLAPHGPLTVAGCFPRGPDRARPGRAARKRPVHK